MAELVESYPERCPEGHPLVPGRMLVGWKPCGCTPNGGHRTIECRHDVGGRECGAQLERPPCTGLVAPGR